MADDAAQPGPAGDEQRDPAAAPGEGVPLGKERPGAPGGQASPWRQGPWQGQQPPGAYGQQPGAAAPPPQGPPPQGPPPIPPAPAPAAPQGPVPGGGFGPPAPPGPAPGYGAGPGAGGGYGVPYPQQAPAAPGYGYPATPGAAGYGYGWSGAAQRPASGKAITAMVLGIVSVAAVCTCWGSFLAVLTSPIALGLGLSARRAADRQEAGGRGQAVAGFVMGLVGLILSVVIVVVLITAIALDAGSREPGPADSGAGGSSVDAHGVATLHLR